MFEEVLLWSTFGFGFGVGAGISFEVTVRVISASKSFWFRWRNRDRIKEYKTSAEVEEAFGSGSDLSSVPAHIVDFQGRPGS